jgi:DtxR family Mn-dependent transcriptional regulator
MSLSALRAGERFQIVRVSDQSPEFLRYLTDSGLAIGAEGSVAESRPEAGIVVLQFGRRQTTLAREIAEKLLVARK